MVKKYYWLKIQDDFYRQKEIKILRQMERGATYIIIYQKMLINSLKNGNKLFYDNLQDSFEEEISLLIDEDVEDVKATVKFLKRANLLESVSREEFVLTQVELLTGSESESTKRVRKYRENKKINDKKDDHNNINEDEIKDSINNKTDDKNEKSNNVTFCNKNVTAEKEKDLEKDLEKDKDLKQDLKNKDSNNHKKSTDQNKKSLNHDIKSFVKNPENENLSKIIKLYEENVGTIYPRNRQYLVEISEKIHCSLFKKAIEICIAKNNMTHAYLNGIIKKWDNLKIYTLEDLNQKYKINLKNNSQKVIDEKMLREMEALEKKMGVS